MTDLKEEKKPFVLCCGFARTGTYTLHKSLDILGFGPTWHGLTVLMYDDDIKWDMNEFWLDAYKKRNNGDSIEWDKLFDKHGFNSAADFPPCDFYKEMYQYYKNSTKYNGIKFILTIRDANEWYNSVLNSIYPHTIPCSWKSWLLYYLSYKFRQQYNVWDEMANYNWNGWSKFVSHKQDVIASYKKRNNDIVQYFSDKNDDLLLIYNVKDGWPRLCKFLNVNVPDKPFPFQNKRNEFNDKENKYKNDTIKTVFTTIIIGGSLSFIVWKYFLKK